MPTTYEPASDEVVSLLNEVIDERFPEIRRCEPAPTISVLMATADEGKDALKKYGSGVVALIKKGSKEDKAEGGPDLRILIDAHQWEESNDRRRAAILAHETRHVAIQWAAKGVPKLDAYNRPKIKLLPDDWVLTGFRDVIEWYGEDAVEYQAVESVRRSLVQLGLSFMGGEDGEPVVLPSATKQGRRKAAMQAATG